MEWLLNLIPYVATGAIGIAVGLAPQIFSTWKSLPKIRGSITSIISGHEVAPSSGTVTGVIIHAYISNERDRPVPVLDYELQVKPKGGKWVTLDPVFQTSGRLTMEFESERITVPMDVEGLRSQSTDLVSSNQPVRGFLVFRGPEWLHKCAVKRWRLFVYDGYGRRHVITTRAKTLRPPQILPTLSPSMEVESLPPQTAPETVTNPTVADG